MNIRLPLVDMRGPQELGALERAHESHEKRQAERKARADARAIAELWECRQLMRRETLRMARRVAR